MEQNDKLVLVYATFPDQLSATATAEMLVRQRLAACVNIIAGMTSVYEWQGQLHCDDEVVAIIKTRATLSEAVMSAVKAHHSYDTPALLVLDIAAGSQPFLDWIAAQTSPSAGPRPE